METDIKAKAMKNIAEIADYLDTINTLGSGSRWLDRFLLHIEAYAKPNVRYSICQNPKLARRNLSCITYKKWVIAFKIYKGRFVIYEIIFGAMLN